MSNNIVNFKSYKERKKKRERKLKELEEAFKEETIKEDILLVFNSLCDDIKFIVDKHGFDEAMHNKLIYMCCETLVDVLVAGCGRGNHVNLGRVSAFLDTRYNKEKGKLWFEKDYKPLF